MNTITKTILIGSFALDGLSSQDISWAQTVTDIDGNVYQTVTIGTQVWMAENLKVTKYRNGDAIPNVTADATWSGGLTTGAYCSYNNNNSYVADYGLLYNWYAVNDSRNIAPAGWHVATDAEWAALETYLGGWQVAGGKLKETGTTHWYSPNTGADNSSGFSALPGGDRDSVWSFGNMKRNSDWWTSTEGSAKGAFHWYLEYNDSYMNSYYQYKNSGLSVRCVKDGGLGIKENIDNSHLTLYPNPSNEKFTITMEDAKTTGGEIAIYNVLGERVYSEIIPEKSGLRSAQQSTIINLSAFPAGIYFLQVNTGEQIINRKLILEK